jgi:hypothetical protein
VSGAQVEAIMARVRTVTTAQKLAAEEALVRAGEKIAEASANRAPVESGRLRSSFLGGPKSLGPKGVRKGHNGAGMFYVEVGTLLFYAPWVEHGLSSEHHHQAPHPMLRPSVHEAEHTIPLDLAASVRAIR